MAAFLKNAAIGPPEKEAYMRSFRIFLGVTYSRVFKKRKRSYMLAIVAFLKNMAIGPAV